MRCLRAKFGQTVAIGSDAAITLTVTPSAHNQFFIAVQSFPDLPVFTLLNYEKILAEKIINESYKNAEWPVMSFEARQRVQKLYQDEITTHKTNPLR